MRLRPLLSSGLLLIIAAFATPVAVLAQFQQRQGGINLLAPFSTAVTSIFPSSGIGTFIDYFNSAGTWIWMVAMGICVLWVLLGGFMIMLSGAESGLRGKGIGHIRWAITGLIILVFAGFILRTLNSLFFT